DPVIRGVEELNQIANETLARLYVGERLPCAPFEVGNYKGFNSILVFTQCLTNFASQLSKESIGREWNFRAVQDRRRRGRWFRAVNGGSWASLGVDKTVYHARARRKTLWLARPLRPRK